MKKAIYSALLPAVMFISCNGGNTDNGVAAANPDSLNSNKLIDSSNNTNPDKVDTSTAALPTDTATYKRKFNKEDSNRLRQTDTLKRELKKKH